MNYLLNDTLYIDSLSLVAEAIRFNKLTEASNVLNNLSFNDKYQYVANTLELRIEHLTENISFPLDEPFIDNLLEIVEDNFYKGEEFKAWLSLANYQFFDMGPYYLDIEQIMAQLEERPASVKFESPRSNSLTIYPNPNNGKFDISLPEDFTNGEMIIYSSAGQMVFKEKMNDANNIHNVNKQLINGIYLLQVIGDNNAVFYDKIIIQK
jgi:hypothetical protein